MKRAVVLLSGGLDSSTTLAVAQRDGYECHGLTVSYGQRNRAELDAAARVARTLDIRSHKVISVPLDAFGGSALTADIEVPKDRQADGMSGGIPITYVPARNTVLLSLALAYAETLGAFDIFLGVNAVDYSGYPDCRPKFIEAFENLANLATKAGVEGGRFYVHAPLIDLTKADIIRLGLNLGVDYSLTLSCYDPSGEGVACGRCDACQIRSKAFAEIGIADPASAKAGQG
jgi:7-cyano-7-deazaguanine synthase